MNVKVTGKDIVVTSAIEEYAEKKLERIEKYFEEDGVKATVTVKAEKNSQVAEIQINTKNTAYRAVTEHSDLYAAIDKDIDILEGQIRKVKTKKEKMNRDDSLKAKEMLFTQNSKPIENEILKELYYEIKPMDPEDAKLKLQEKPGNIFFTFVNIDTGKVNVIFKLKDSNNYGLIEPEA
jgi:putative sigma-54 modulation protein